MRIDLSTYATRLSFNTTAVGDTIEVLDSI